MQILRGFLLGVLASVTTLTVHPSLAQKPPKRPEVRFVSDTNDAIEYIRYGSAVLEKDPAGAAAAFYWATRIDPSNADAQYGRWASTILDDPRLLSVHMEGGRRARENKDLRRADSLQLHALMLNPFLHRKFDRRLLVEYLRRENETPGGFSGPALLYAIDAYLNRAGPATKAWLSYSDGDFESALGFYATALKSSRSKADLFVDRARIFAGRSEVDSAIANFQAALAELRQRDEKEKVSVYMSKALFEHSIALLQEGHDRRDLAREAYGRALQEDLAFYPAHVRLGFLGVTMGDTLAALGELDLAAQAAPDEPLVRYQHGYVLSSLKRDEAALVELRKAVDLEPLYALPYFEIGRVLDRRGDQAGARAAYEAYLKRASQRAAQRSQVEERLAALGTK